MEKGGAFAGILRTNKQICPSSKHAQVTIFIIIAIVIVVMGVIIYLFFPQLKSTISGGAKNPQSFIYECIQEDIEGAIGKISLQGGSITPERYFEYNYIPIEYLCYTNENYKTCIIQQPLLKSHIEKEIKDEIKDNVEFCFNSLKESYEKKGYGVNLKKGKIRIELLPQRVVSTFNYSLTLTRGDTEKYDSFNVVINNNLYELISIVNSILEWETTYGEADVRPYMVFYPELKVEKNLRDDGTKIYTLTNRDSGDKFQFASRSLVFPAGY